MESLHLSPIRIGVNFKYIANYMQVKQYWWGQPRRLLCFVPEIGMIKANPLEKHLMLVSSS